jgi:hypothetical protein
MLEEPRRAGRKMAGLGIGHEGVAKVGDFDFYFFLFFWFLPFWIFLIGLGPRLGTGACCFEDL